MLYHLFEYINKHFNIPGSGVFKYISFRVAMVVIFSLIISMVFGKYIIKFLQRKQIGEEIRNLGLEGQMQKKGTPTMGGIIILLSILIPVFLFCNLTNIYIILMIVSTIWLGLIGFLDDYIKVFRHNKEGLKGKFKIVGQIGLGLIVGLTMWFSDSIVVREKSDNIIIQNEQQAIAANQAGINVKSTITTIPFFKDNEFDYNMLIPGHNQTSALTWIVFVIVVILIVTAVSNGANLTDGMDGLATGISAIIGVVLGIFAYLSGNVIYAGYLNIMYIPNSGELVIFMGAFIGALIGFLWYNSYPAQVFMGDTGSLAIGGIIAVFAIMIRKELLIPILCGVFFAESLSVMMQMMYFKYTKRKYGEGRRVFKMTPLHHHFQKQGYAGINAIIQKPRNPIPESKIVVRFWIITLLLAIISIVTLKLR
ncbi:MAG: phospho-N-acetylmuramoyl-pentapeptide-transferase [Prevotellaceae bacterium]|jgi:phospho-N-acetylmuramoyl-pentapeptide-transferase|nr:phospho-N-acetylmuramoyl-pentapeptide-transferase [Prevotellaceae bacterium]